LRQEEPVVRRADACARRAAVYAVLALGFAEPSRPSIEALAAGEFAEGIRDALGQPSANLVLDAALDELTALGSSLREPDRDLFLSDLRVEYARLFTGPGEPAVLCYASQYLERDERGRAGRLNGEAATFAAAAYRAEGVEPSSERGELPDHITLELEFLYHLRRREERAWLSERVAEAARLHDMLGNFLHGHAARWMPEFAESVRAASRVALYRALAELLTMQLHAEQGESGPRGAYAAT
jgi:TorA maturation chaperone TorD